MIDVIIPAYNAHKTIEQTLTSIAFQSIVDKLNVYIINDYGKDYKEIIEYYSNFMNIKELQLEKNSGPGQARQYGIDNSKNEYIIFIDSDDVFADSLSIETLYNELSNSNNDIIVSTFLEELENTFIPKQTQYVWMHGKMYKRSYLIKNNIRFNDTYTNEDCGFNQLCYMCGANYLELNRTTYIWRNNYESITRTRTEESKIKYLKMFVYNMIWAIEESLKRNYNENRVSEIIYGTIVASYHYYLQNEEIFRQEKLLNQLSVLIKYHNEHPISEDDKLFTIKNQLYTETSGPNLYKVYNPSITLEDFINILKEGV